MAGANSSVFQESKLSSPIVGGRNGKGSKGKKTGDKPKKKVGAKKGGASCALSPSALSGGRNGKSMRKRGGAVEEDVTKSACEEKQGYWEVNEDQDAESANALGKCTIPNAAEQQQEPTAVSAEGAPAAAATQEQATAAAAAPGNVCDGGARRKKGGAKPAKGKGKGKKGGALMDDIKNLAVPFAILLAKQGLEGMFSSKKSATAKASASTGATGAIKNRKKTMTGGSCGCAANKQDGGKAKKGGASKSSKKSNMSLTESIDNFLRKY